MRIEKKSVLMLLQSDFPPDIRVEKEAKSLESSNKFRVNILCNNSQNFPSQSNYKNLNIFRLSYLRFLGKTGNRIKNYPLWFNPIWLAKGFWLLFRVRPNIIHVHDLPLMFLGLLYARLFNAKLIYDLHENYPATFDIWKKSGIIKLLIRNKLLARWYDRFSLKKSDGVIVVEQEHINWIVEHYKICRPVSVVSNTVDLQYYQNIPANAEILSKFQNHFIVSYVGKISVERDLDVAIKSMTTLKQKIPDILFLIVGEGPDSQRLQKMSYQLQLNDIINFIDWVTFEQTASYIKLSDICLIPQGSNDLIDNGAPHKLYQYMSLGKPVIVADSKALKRVVSENNCGLVFRSKDEISLAQAILNIYNNPKNYSANGKKAVANKYNWQRSAQVLLDLYDSLSGKK